MKITRQFDGLDKGEALTEVLKEFPAELLDNFEFDNDTQIATFDARAVPIMASGELDPESEESKTLNIATEQMRATKKEYDLKIQALTTKENELTERAFQLNVLENAIDEKQKQLNQTLDEIRKKTQGIWKRTKSFFHGIN